MQSIKRNENNSPLENNEKEEAVKNKNIPVNDEIIEKKFLDRIKRKSNQKRKALILDKVIKENTIRTLSLEDYDNLEILNVIKYDRRSFLSYFIYRIFGTEPLRALIYISLINPRELVVLLGITEILVAYFWMIFTYSDQFMTQNSLNRNYINVKLYFIKN